MSINSATISGNLGRDAELRRTRSGTAILSFSVAVNERRKDANGEWGDYTNWVGVTMFGKRAEAIANYLVKGCKVSVQGKLHYSEWERDGQKRSKLEVVADEVEFMSRQDGGRGAQQVHAEVIDAPAGVYDDDIPF